MHFIGTCIGKFPIHKGQLRSARAAKKYRGTPEVAMMDRLDMEILALLQDDAKAGLKKIARKAGIPMSTAHHRILRMEKEGVIRRYAAIPDYRKIGLPVAAYVLVNVDYAGIRSQEAVAKEIRKLPNVLEANIISGEIDIIAKVRAADIDALGDIVISKIRNIKGVAKTVTSVVMKEMG